MVTGLSSSGTASHAIRVSPRNQAIAAGLAHRFPGVSVASSNQDVLDSCEMAVIAVKPLAARSVLSELRFRPNHHVISVVSALPLRSVCDMVAPAAHVTRAVPLPSTARRLGPTAIYPPDRLVENLFAAIGTVFAVDTEDQFNAICTATATIASYFAFNDTIASWLAQNSIPQSTARDYVARMVLGLTTGAVDAPDLTFQSLAAQHATAGGINEQFLKHLADRGALEIVSEGLDAVLRRVTAASQKSS
jgi:pyrroline-5-carboxylate reductase